MRQRASLGKSRIKHDFEVGLSSNQIDSSEYVLLAVGLIENSLNAEILSAISQELLSIRQDYLATDYKNAIEKIKSLAARFDALSLLRNPPNHFFDHPMRNHSRRYFETVFAEHLQKDIDTNPTYPSVNKLSLFLKTINDVGVEWDCGEVKNAQDASKVILSFIKYGDNVELELKKKSQHYQKKERIYKGDETYSLNPGVMVSVQSNYADRLTELAYGKVADRYRLDATKPGFSSEHKEIPLVGSVSGSTFTMVAILSWYMQAHQHDPDLQKDINNIVKEFLKEYIQNGYHSYLEMMSVLIEKPIYAVFNQNNIDVISFPNDLVESAFDATKEYAVRNVLKRRTLQEIDKEASLSTCDMLESFTNKNITNKKLAPLTHEDVIAYFYKVLDSRYDSTDCIPPLVVSLHNLATLLLSISKTPTIDTNKIALALQSESLVDLTMLQKVLAVESLNTYAPSPFVEFMQAPMQTVNAVINDVRALKIQKLEKEFSPIVEGINAIIQSESQAIGKKKEVLDILRKTLTVISQAIHDGTISDLNEIKALLKKPMQDLAEVHKQSNNGYFAMFAKLVYKNYLEQQDSIMLTKLQPNLPIFTQDEGNIDEIINQYRSMNNAKPNTLFLCLREDKAEDSLMIDMFLTNKEGEVKTLNTADQKIPLKPAFCQSHPKELLLALEKKLSNFNVYLPKIDDLKIRIISDVKTLETQSYNLLKNHILDSKTAPIPLESNNFIFQNK